MIIEKPRASPKPIEREIPKATDEPKQKPIIERLASAVNYQSPAHAENCRCYSCKPPK